MTITNSSRYSQSEVLWVKTTKRGNKQTAYLNTVVVMNRPYISTVMTEDDSLQLLASRAYKNSQRWWVLADANPQIFYPLDIFAGHSLRVPS